MDITKSKYWIATNGVPLNKDIRYTLTPEADRLLCDVSDRTTIRHNYDQMEEAFSCILGNLYHADIVDEPLIYSRNSNRYIIERQRYGYEFYTYDMFRRLVDAMYELGLIQGVKGLHIRMLYHLIGIDYLDECYVYEKSDKANKPDRDRIKLASLIVINSDDRRTAIRAIHDQCRRKGIHYPAGEFGRYRSLVDRFENYHERIKEYFLKGKGLELQYLDSTIMANILDRHTKQNIPALPVHDSVICQARHEEFLRQVMIEEYQKVMGFEPVID